MAAVKRRHLLAGVCCLCLVPCAAAGDAGDDFSNNLFSDLAPLLALFGERVTMQYISQSTGWADNIILSMAPLGIVTIVVGAIRVGGPTWLKAIIGRAREPRAIVEAELMSSTSKEVCELWNGRQIVRVMGEGPIREFIILWPEDGEESKEQSQARETTLTEARSNSDSETGAVSASEKNILVTRLRDATEKYLPKYEPTVRQRMSPNRVSNNHHGRDPVKTEQGLGEARNDPDGPSVIILRNTDAGAPNLTLNVGYRSGSGDIFITAFLGIVLQLGVLVYFGFATYYPALEPLLRKDGKSIADYAFPSTATGTLMVIAGMLIGCHVIEGATVETKYHPTYGRKAQVVWLQRAGMVNEQGFESFAVFPGGSLNLFTTSEQKRLQGAKPTDSFMPSNAREAMAFVSAVVSLCGYVVQFVGLRGMHWSASVAQLGATAVMAILRTALSTKLAEPPRAQRLISGHEIDWLAMTLGGDSSKAPWLHPSKADGDLHTRSWANDGGWDWRIAAVEDPMTWKASPTSQPDSPKSFVLSSQSSFPSVSEKSSRSEDADAPCTAHRVMQIRRDLGELAGWHGSASAQAIAIARAIEVTMNTLFGATGKADLTWSLTALESLDGSSHGSIDFRADRKTGKWKAYADEIDAALSLWLYSTHEDDKDPGEADNGSITDIRKFLPPKNDEWLRDTGTPVKRNLRLLGKHEETLQRDISWWVPGAATRVVMVERLGAIEDGATVEVEAHRVVGFAPTGWDSNSGSPVQNGGAHLYRTWKLSDSEDLEDADVVLASESYSTLKTLLAQHMFSAFMWAAARSMDAINSPAEMRSTEQGPTWQSFTLHNAQLSSMVQDIANTGLGSLEDIYLAVVPPLSAEDKLPRTDEIIARTQGRK